MTNFALTPIENEGKRVLTTAQLAEAYETTEKRITENFNRNATRYTEGKHFYRLTGNELKMFKSENANCGFAPNLNTLYLWTEKGALLHAKSLNTDKAWEVYDFLVESYFRVQQMQKTLDSYMIEDPIERAKRWIEEYEERHALEIKVEQQQELIKAKDEKLEKCKPFVQFAIKLQNTNNTVSMEQAAKILKEDNIEIGRNTLFKLLREHKVLMENNSPYQRYIDLDLFKITAVIKEDKYNKEHMYPVTRVTGKGLIFLNKKLREWFGMNNLEVKI